MILSHILSMDWWAFSHFSPPAISSPQKPSTEESSAVPGEGAGPVLLWPTWLWVEALTVDTTWPSVVTEATDINLSLSISERWIHSWSSATPWTTGLNKASGGCTCHSHQQGPKNIAKATVCGTDCICLPGSQAFWWSEAAAWDSNTNMASSAISDNCRRSNPEREPLPGRSHHRVAGAEVESD